MQTVFPLVSLQAIDDDAVFVIVRGTRIPVEDYRNVESSLRDVAEDARDVFLSADAMAAMAENCVECCIIHLGHAKDPTVGAGAAWESCYLCCAVWEDEVLIVEAGEVAVEVGDTDVGEAWSRRLVGNVVEGFELGASPFSLMWNVQFSSMPIPTSRLDWILAWNLSQLKWWS